MHLATPRPSSRPCPGVPITAHLHGTPVKPSGAAAKPALFFLFAVFAYAGSPPRMFFPRPHHQLNQIFLSVTSSQLRPGASALESIPPTSTSLHWAPLEQPPILGAA